MNAPKEKLFALYILDFELSEMVRVSKWDTKKNAEYEYNKYSMIKREIRELGK